MVLSTAEALIILVYLFDPIFLETPSVRWLMNKSRVSVQIFMIWRIYEVFIS